MGKYLQIWKVQMLIPIFKKGLQSDKNDYRSVSLKSIVGKLLESIIRGRVQKFLEENKLIQASMVSLRWSHV